MGDILAKFGRTAPMWSRGEEAKAIKDAARQQARCWVVKRTHLWRNRFPRILVCWGKKSECYLAFLHFTCALIAFRTSGLFG